jgi:uracil-DNA glycosylase family 4
MKPELAGSRVKLRDVNRRLADVHHAITSCERCTRLRDYCRSVARVRRRAFRDEVYWGRPVPGFGDPLGRLLLVGLAPAAHGANRTGRVFTGDGVGGSSDFLMSALYHTGFASQPTSHRADDGLTLHDAFILAAVRCAPPQNKPTPDEIARCQVHLDGELAVLPNVEVVVALGKIAFDAWLRRLTRLGVAITPRPAFGHGSVARFDAPPGVKAPLLVGCYHPSRQNTHTGRLTARMMEEVFARARVMIEAGSAG